MSTKGSTRARAYTGLHAKAIRRALMLAGLGATLIVAIAAVMANLDADGLRVRSTVVDRAPLPDALAATFARCNGLGTAAADDAICRAAWAENRLRFFGSRARPASEN